MKRNTFLALFITSHILCVILQIHKHTLFIRESFIKQKHEKVKTELAHEQQRLTQQLYLLRDYQAIEAFARNTLNMKPIQIHAIKQIQVTKEIQPNTPLAQT